MPNGPHLWGTAPNMNPRGAKAEATSYSKWLTFGRAGVQVAYKAEASNAFPGCGFRANFKSL